MFQIAQTTENYKAGLKNNELEKMWKAVAVA
jgi:hypothetical protein